MATIEPRLIHLLNDSKSNASGSGTDLPPIQLLAFGAASPGHGTISLPPLELDAAHQQRGDKPAQKAIPPYYASSAATSTSAGNGVASDENGVNGRPALSSKEHSFTKETSTTSTTASSRPAKHVHPLQLLLEDPEANGSSHSLRMILDDVLPAPDAAEDPATKKRHRALTVKDDFVQLPQPLKKQKSTQNVLLAVPSSSIPIMPPIINGLHEPPPDAAVFPPIALELEGTYEHSEHLSMLKDFIAGSGSGSGSGPAVISSEDKDKDRDKGTEGSNDTDKANAAKVKRKAAKPRRKWSEEETNHLLLGVSKHGVGKWTNILEDPDYKFNERTAGDLKDRFRTCCPDELLRTKGALKTAVHQDAPQPVPAEAPAAPPPPAPTAPKQTTSIALEKILIDTDDATESEKQEAGTPSSQQQHDSDSQPRQKRSRAHRKKLEDLAELGIRGPFKKSHRRERRPFTEQDDRQILDGLEHYGPAWTKIQRDPRFGLSGRQPTDLRDRVRNKYPEVYARIEKGHFQVKEPGKTGSGSGNGSGGGGGNNLLEPSVNTTIESSFINGTQGGAALEPHHLHRSGSKEDFLSRWPLPSNALELTDSLPGGGMVSSFDNPAEPTSFMSSAVGVGEMDISRLLLDDAHVSHDARRI